MMSGENVRGKVSQDLFYNSTFRGIALQEVIWLDSARRVLDANLHLRVQVRGWAYLMDIYFNGHIL